MKRNDNALATSRKVIEADTSKTSDYLLALFFRLTNRHEQALSILEDMIKTNPEDFNPYLAIASINLHLGKNVHYEYFKKARQYMPKEDWYNRACLESVCGNFDLAFEYLEKAAKRKRFDSSWAWEDPDLCWIRDDPRFIKIVGKKP